MPEGQIHLSAALLFSIIGFLVIAIMAGGWWVIWRAVTRLESKVDGMNQTCGARLADCLKLFVDVGDFKDWKPGRDELWRALNLHGHSTEGKVVRND